MSTKEKQLWVNVNSQTMLIGDLAKIMERGFIDFKTSYKPEPNIWGINERSSLIESLLLGLPIPSLYFIEYSPKDWEVIDGMQRCRAIRDFAVDGTLTLNNLVLLPEYNGKKFSDFSFKERREFLTSQITVHLLDKNTPNAIRNNIVARLNMQT